MRPMSSLILAFACCASAAPANAQILPANSPLAKIYACAEIADPAARLACFDGEVGALQRQERAGEIAAVDAATVKELERESFGFSLPNLAALLPQRDEQSPARLSTTIERVIDGDRPAFVMTNGQIWRAIEPARNRHARAGATVEIRKASFGSFLMSVEGGGAAVRVRREQ